MISCVEWVPKGVADPNPKRYEMSKVEEELIRQGLEQEKEEANMNVQEETSMQEEENEHPTKKSTHDSTNSLPADLRMDEYSSEEEEEEENGNEEHRDATIGNLLIGTVPEMEMPPENNNNSDSDSDDDLKDVPDTREFMPLSVDGLEAMGLTHGGAMPSDEYEFDQDELDDASDAQDVRLSPNDAILVVAKTEEDFASLEVHVYEEDTGNLFVHHDISLPSFPLALAHGDVLSGTSSGNYCAVGTFSPGIEVWNLDVLNPLEPSSVLGVAKEEEAFRARVLGTRAKNTKQAVQTTNGGHTDAVMALSWNKVHRQVIASGSADCTVKLWDVTQAFSNKNDTASSTLTHHKDKVQTVAWHPTEGTLLATGSYDKTAALVDARSTNTKTVKIPADIEAMAWDPHCSHLLTVASEDGTIQSWDVRKFDTKTPFWSMVASDYGGVSDLSYNCHVPGMMVTCAIDKTVTVWDTHSPQDGVVASYPPSSSPPCACGTKDMGVGKLYTVSFYPSSPWLLGCGGAGNEVALWDLSREDAIQTRFGNRVSHESHKKQDQQETDFEAIMATANTSVETKQSTSKHKKKKKGKQKKAHRKGR